MKTMDPEVEKKLIRAIRSLLNAGRNVGQVSDALSPQISFGKYDGCTPNAIKDIATQVCHEINRETAKANAEIRAIVNKKLNEDFPNLKQYFKRF